MSPVTEVTGLMVYEKEESQVWSQEVIAAISTPPGEGGIAIVRLSGDKAWDVAGRVFRSRRHSFAPRPWRVFLGDILDGRGERIDECLCTYFKGPKSFTGEDVVEFGIHGGAFVAGRVLESVLGHGARLAAPGEFTKRAFLNGRLDLSQAEAVIDIIRSNSDIALRNAGRHLQGQLSGEIGEARSLLLSIMAQIEASIDFPEHDVPSVTYGEISHALNKTAAQVAGLIDTTRAGRVAREGLKVVLVGRPNVGKSSLLNRLAGRDRAIVADIAGTTRDTVEVELNIEGVLISLVDTAGLRESIDVIECLGIARTQAAIEQADLLLVLIDGTVEPNKEDMTLLQSTAKRRRIVLVTKEDLPQHGQLLPTDAIYISALTSRGIPELRARLAAVARASIGPENSLLVTNLRHASLLHDALQKIESASSSVTEHWDLDVIAIDVRAAYERLGEISGDTVSMDVANQIFSQFCIGK